MLPQRPAVENFAALQGLTTDPRPTLVAGWPLIRRNPSIARRETGGRAEEIRNQVVSQRGLAREGARRSVQNAEPEVYSLVTVAFTLLVCD